MEAMKKQITVTLGSVLALLGLLAGCGGMLPQASEPGETLGSAPATVETTETTEPQSLPTGPTAPETTEATAAPAQPETTSYTRSMNALVPIYAGPDYDSGYRQIVGEDGVFTIVEERKDTQGNLWGRLKSGVGWVDLTALDAEGPISIGFANKAILKSAQHRVTVDSSEWSVQVAIRANEPLKEIQLAELVEVGEDVPQQELLYTLPELAAKKLLVADLAFPGDMTAYCISFTDKTGQTRTYEICMSGRDGTLQLWEQNA